MMKKTALPAAIALLAATGLAPVSSQADAPDWRNNRLILPERVTVGPSDNYQAQVDRGAQRLIYTRYQNLLSQLVVQNLVTGASRNLLPPDYDAKDPALSPDGNRLAITSYRENALGAVCLLSLEEESRPECLTPSGTRAWMPFWVSNDRLGYLRDGHPVSESGQSQLVIHPLSGGEPEVLLSGHLSSPAISKGGRYLIFHRRGGEERTGIHIHDLDQGISHGPLAMDLPGLSSYAVIDDEGEQEYLYFSHYLSDTSGDQQIDAEDHSVIFRLPLQEALQAQEPLLPEQLTSVVHNCNFPALGDGKLYVTCAYEGSLDTYRLPLTGQVPEHWGEEELQQAHAHTASHEDRLYLLNTIRYRTGDNGLSMLGRLLANHLEMGEHTAGLYYADQLQQMHAAADRPDAQEQADFYGNLKRLIVIQAAARQQPRGVLTAAFRQQVQQARKQLRPTPAAAEAKVFQAWLDYLLRQPQQAADRLQDSEIQALPLAHYLKIELQRRVYASEPEIQLEHFLSASRNPVIDRNARLFYAFEALKLIMRSDLDPERHLNLLGELARQSTDPRVADLFANEADLLRLSRAEERSEERELYTAVSTRLREVQEEPMMHRVAHIRAIHLMGLAEKYDFMELMSRHWLTTTGIAKVNFAATAEQYAMINLSRGYGAWSQGEENTALNTFYSVIRQTNDLEALYNLLTLGVNPQADAALKERMDRLYDQLRAEDLLGANQRYAQALRPLLFSESFSDDELEQAADLLKGLEAAGLDTGVKDLLLGSIYHRRLLAGQKEYEHDKQLFQQSHYHYMLALDLAYRNPRVQAAVLDNLGQLHFTVRNYGLAAAFFAQRQTLPFLSDEHEIRVGWRSARALFHSNRMDAAAQQAEQALAKAEAVAHPERIPLRERTAFYNLQAGHYARAVELYGALLDAGALQGNNHVKAVFSHGYALHKEGRTEEAGAAFEDLLEQLPKAEHQAASNTRLAPFQPKRLQVQAYGFLAELAPELTVRERWLKQRIELLEQMQSRRLEYGFDEQGRLSQLIQTRLQLVETLEQQQETQALAAVMAEILDNLEAYGKTDGSYNSRPVLQSLYGYLTLASYYPQAFPPEPKRLRKLLEDTQEELHVELYMPPVNHGHQLKLHLLEALYTWRQNGSGDPDGLAARIVELEEGAAWQGLASTRPDWHRELNELATGIRTLAAQ